MLISIVCLVPVWPLLSSMAVLYHVNYKLRRPHCSFSFPLHYIDQFLPWRFLLFVYFRLWSSTKTACQLREPLANKATGKPWSYPTWKVIPEPGSADRQVGGVPSPHVTAWFPGFSVRFEGTEIETGIELSDQMKPLNLGLHLSPIQAWFSNGACFLTNCSTNSFSSKLLIFTSSPPSPLQYAWAWCQVLMVLSTR